VIALNIALGADSGDIKFTKTLDTTNHVATEFDKNVITVKIDTLDKVLNERGVPILLKIDVEGFETEVLKGASKTLLHSDLKAIIIELNGSGTRYGYDETLIHEKLIKLGFKPHIYHPKDRTIIEIDKFNCDNTIYIRDNDYVASRLKNSDKIRILGEMI
jgi:hypothetical protein